MGRRHKGRAVDGILLLDKPQGVSSNYVLQGAKRLFGAAKAGHTGALDPLATGMLPITFGEATKFSHYLLNADKRYQTTAKLGVRTDSSDADGQVIGESEVPPDLTQETIQMLIDQHFKGEIEQVPSMFSALKYKGQPLYKLAREGKKVEVKPRRVTVFDITIMDFRGDEVDLDIRCSKGTYIRSIVEDLGLYLGCGAHVKMLRRLDSGPYQAEQMISLETLQGLAEPKTPDEGLESIQTRLDAVLLPPWSAIESESIVAELSAEETDRICHGMAVDWPHEAHSLVRLVARDTGQFIGIGEITQEGRLKPKRLISTQQS